MGIFKEIFNFVKRTKVDEEILENYLEIQILVDELNNSLNFLDAKFKNVSRTKEYRNYQYLRKIGRKVQEDFKDLYEVKKNKLIYKFEKTKEINEKVIIVEQQKRIVDLLKMLIKQFDKIKQIPFKELELTKFKEELNQVLFKQEELNKKREELFAYAKHIEEDILEFSEEILEDAYKNKMNHKLLLLSDGKKVLYSTKFNLIELRKLELLPLLVHTDIQKRSPVLFELHQDKTLKLYHYNLLYKGENIHLVPKEFSKEAEKLIA
jgi:hypothetical protein